MATTVENGSLSQSCLWVGSIKTPHFHAASWVSNLPNCGGSGRSAYYFHTSGRVCKNWTHIQLCAVSDTEWRLYSAKATGDFLHLQPCLQYCMLQQWGGHSVPHVLRHHRQYRTHPSRLLHNEQEVLYKCHISRDTKKELSNTDTDPYWWLTFNTWWVSV